MENTPQPNSHPNPTLLLRRTFLIVVSLLLVGILAIGVVALLRAITSKPQVTSTNINAPLAEEVIAAIKTPEAIKSLNSFSQQDSQSDTAHVIYKADNHSYTVSIPTKNSVLFVAKAAGPYSGSTKTEEEIVAFIVGKGYEKTANTGSATSNTPKYITLKSPLSVCQLLNSQPTEGQQTFAFYSINCTDNTAISQEYANVETLLSLYKKSGQLPNFNEATRTNSTEDNKSLSIINLRGEASGKLLLFAAIDNNWEFIGDLSSSADDSNGKYGISAEVRSKINDARYGDFLKKHFK